MPNRIKGLSVLVLGAVLVSACSGNKPWANSSDSIDRVTLTRAEFKPAQWGCADTGTFHAKIIGGWKDLSNFETGQAEQVVPVRVPVEVFKQADVYGGNNRSDTKPGCAEQPWVTAWVTFMDTTYPGKKATGTLSTSNPKSLAARDEQARRLKASDKCEKSGSYKICGGLHDDGYFGMHEAKYILRDTVDEAALGNDLFYIMCVNGRRRCGVSLPYDGLVRLNMPTDRPTDGNYDDVYDRYLALRRQAAQYIVQ